VSFALVILRSIAFSRAEAATAEETLAKINRLPAAERQAALIKEAKNEKTVIWYAPMNREDLRQFTAGFEAEYPFLRIEILTGGPQSLLNRILTERRAGKDYFDILNIRSSALYTLKKAGAIGRYDSPQRPGLRPGFYDKDGYFNGIWASLMVYLFNTKQVSRAQAPQIRRRSVASQVERKNGHGSGRRRLPRRAPRLLRRRQRQTDHKEPRSAAVEYP